MSSNKTEIAKKTRLATSNPLDVVPDEIPSDVPYGLPISLDRAQAGIKALMARGFHKPGDVENRLGYYVGQIARA
jgi:hypothetical protein